MNKTPGATLLKVISALMLVGSAIGTAGAILAFQGIASLRAAGTSSAAIYLSIILIFLSSISALLCGVRGFNVSRTLCGCHSCFLWAFVYIVLLLVGEIINGIWGSGFAVEYLISGLIVPILYLVALVKIKPYCYDG